MIELKTGHSDYSYVLSQPPTPVSFLSEADAAIEFSHKAIRVIIDIYHLPISNLFRIQVTVIDDETVKYGVAVTVEAVAACGPEAIVKESLVEILKKFDHQGVNLAIIAAFSNHFGAEFPLGIKSDPKVDLSLDWDLKVKKHDNETWSSSLDKYHAMAESQKKLYSGTHDLFQGSWKAGKYASSHQLASESHHLPNISVEVKHPVRGGNYPISTIIIDLNDKLKWTREKIADWLETLDVDLRFKVD